MSTHVVSALAWERMVTAVEKVRRRLRRAAAALESAGIPYAVTGGNAVAIWVSEVDEAAVRNTQDVDLLLHRSDLDAARQALEAAGFVYRRSAGLDMFLDSPQAGVRDAVHLVFAGEKVRPEHLFPAPEIAESRPTSTIRVLDLLPLLRMKLTAFRRKDQVHVLDLIGVGLVDASWAEKLPPELGARLQELLAHPDD